MTRTYYVVARTEEVACYERPLSLDEATRRAKVLRRDLKQDFQVYEVTVMAKLVGKAKKVPA